MYHGCFMHSSVDGHLGCSHVLAIVNSAAINIGAQVTVSILVSSGYMPNSGIAGSSGESVQSISPVQLFVTPWTAACQTSLSITNSQSLLKLMSIELVMPSNHLILCCPLLFPPSIFPSIRVILDESVLHIRWPKHWSFSFSISPSNEYSGLISFRD